MKLSRLIIAAAVIAGSSITGAALAHEHQPQQHGDKAHAQHAPLKRMLAGLDLSDRQREQIKQLAQQHRTEQQAMRRDNDARVQLHNLLLADQFDEVTARSLLQQHQHQQIERQIEALKLQHQVRQLLTPEQRLQLDEKREQWQKKRQQRPSS